LRHLFNSISDNYIEHCLIIRILHSDNCI